MSLTEIERFRADLGANQDLMAEAQSVSGSPEAIAAFMVAKGYEVSVEDVAKALGSGKDGSGGDRELSDDELDLVSGGEEWWPPSQSGGTNGIVSF